MTKIEPPLVTGEWVVAEQTREYPTATMTIKLEGRVSSGPFVGGRYIDERWTILERRPPRPDWADADAILVEFRSGVRECYLRSETQGVDWSAFGHRSEMSWLTYPAVKSIRGLYFRDPS